MTTRINPGILAVGLTLMVLVALSVSPALGQITMYVVDDKVGVGTDTPDEKLHVKDGNLKIEQTSGGATLDFVTAGCSWEIFQNGVTGRLNYSSPCAGATGPSFKLDPQAQKNLFRVGVAGADMVDINGNLDIDGNLVVSGDCTEQDGACADYVFEPDYELRPLAELEAFIAENGHLPNVPSAEDMRQNGVNMTRQVGRMLEKIEELTLYTLQQQNLIEELQTNLEELRDQKE